MSVLASDSSNLAGFFVWNSGRGQGLMHLSISDATSPPLRPIFAPYYDVHSSSTTEGLEPGQDSHC
jgi:hypothetical protein